MLTVQRNVPVQTENSTLLNNKRNSGNAPVYRLSYSDQPAACVNINKNKHHGNFQLFSGGGMARKLSPGIKWQGREADHSSPTSAEIQTMWIYTSTPPYAFMA
jgi:hypothetical protein